MGYKILQAPDGQIVTQRLTDAYEVSNNGAGTYYETRQQLLAYLRSAVSANTSTIYVSNNGSPTGAGTPTDPVQTYAQALAIIGSSATQSTPYLVQFDAGVFTMSACQLNPWIFLSGSLVGSTYFSVSGGITLNLAAFAGITASTGISSINGSHGTVLSTVGGSSANVTVYLDNFQTELQASFLGNTANPLSVSITNCNLSYGGFTTILNSASLFSGGGNSFGLGLTVTNTAGNSNVALNNDINLGALVSTQTGTNNIALLALRSGVTSVSASQASSGTNIIKLDSSTWKSLSISSGAPTFVRTDPDVQTKVVYYSINGSDTFGIGTKTLPFATPVAALTYALTLNPTLANPVIIHGEPGTYHVTSAAMIYPNIYHEGAGVIWTQSGISTITFAGNSAWLGSFAQVSLKDIKIDHSLTLTLDSTGITSFNTNVILGDGFFAENGPTFKRGNSGHIYSLNINDAVVLDTQGTGVTMDSMDTLGYGPHQISNGGALALLTTVASATFLSVGNAGIGGITLTTSGSNSFVFEAYTGKQIVFNGGVIANGSGGVQIFRDATTWVSDTNYSGTHASTVLDENISLGNTGASLNYGATTNWDARSNFTAALELTGDTIMANPTGLIGPQDYQLDVTMDATGGRSITSWGANFQFPNGIPPLNTAANAITSFLFHSPDGILMICRSPAGYKAPNTVTTNLATGTTLTANTVNNVTDAASHSWPLPASPKVGDIVKARVNGAGGQFTMSLNAGQSGVFGGVAITASITSTYRGAVQAGNALTAECMVGGASAQWIFIPEQGSYDWV